MPWSERTTAARVIQAEATPAEMGRALAAVGALLGGPHCVAAGRTPDEWVAVALADLLAEGAALPDDLPLWVALRDRVAERVVSADNAPRLVDVFATIDRRVAARLVARRLDDVGARVLLGLYDGMLRTEQLATTLGLTCRDVIRARDAIARVAMDVAVELRVRRGHG